MESKLKALIILALSIATMATGFLMGMNEKYLTGVIPPSSTPLILAVITFGFGMLFFGYLPWVMTYFIGEHLGIIFKTQTSPTIEIILTILSVTLMAFSSSWLGTSLHNDLVGKQSHFQKEVKKNIIIIIIALILAIAPQFLL